MPEGPAERGVEANASAHAPCRALVTRRALDGAEHSGSIEPVMAGRNAASRYCLNNICAPTWLGRDADDVILPFRVDGDSNPCAVGSFPCSELQGCAG